jgi:hypothetical protein
MGDRKEQGLAYHLSPITYHLLRLFVPCVLAATAAEFIKFQALRGRLLVLRRRVITAFAGRTLQDNVIARHKSPPSETRN